tara:strand:- start:114 stop:281 length:168 start_codon:yes stop_codon:yes gene_type:complete
MEITVPHPVELEEVVLVENLHLLQGQMVQQTPEVVVVQLVVAVHILMDKVVQDSL